MKVTLDIQDNKAEFFMELVGSLDFVKTVNKDKAGSKGKIESELSEAFNDVKLYRQGKKKLNNAKDFLNELRNQNNRTV